MARRPAHAPLAVMINGRRVGRLSRAASGAVSFSYDPGWLGWAAAFPVSLSLPLREEGYAGAPVLAVFDNLLPDAEPVRRRVAERVGAAGTDPFSLLAALGADCVGALQFLPEDRAAGPVGAVSGRAVTEAEIAQVLRNLASAPLGLDPDAEFRISLAGAQEKTALLRAGGRWMIPQSTTATTHILKPQIGALPQGIDLSDSVENEFLCLRLASALGLPVARAEIADFEEVRTLVVERFDRLHAADGRLLRLPQEDFCQALGVPPARKYQSEGGPGLVEMLRLLLGADRPEADRLQLLRAAMVFWLLGATDGHAKNFSLFLRPGGRFGLTPLYDVLSAEPARAAGALRQRQFRLAMSAGRRRHYLVDEIMPRHFAQTAAEAGLGPRLLRPLVEELADTGPARAEAAVAALPPGFPASLATAVLDGLTRRSARLALPEGARAGG
ncbi:type II toxin-antitoxin system HipA family toxin (plasmid) [Paroceanicella profunda]|uniref:Type II toxin-antitoxin system HipA family toxin n=1 Tax=Paroceanicella profunda TaxID=2579971 RepID=A0A5B8G3J1_9RHOB|nr:type II toxin-antitoxin system HipA family toxin [Paroceanicella profunda]QDL94550.1 type II toxin-antitoxin system HipA family toxin [Paroceanicella profunda]